MNEMELYYFVYPKTKVRVFSVFHEQAITPIERTAIGYLFVLPLKLGIEQMNKVPGKI